jgi:hypothetical protein
VLLNPSVMALVLVSSLVSLMTLLAAVFALQVLRHWDIESGSEHQLGLERRTYLVSTLMSWAFAAQLLSLLLFVYTAEALSEQFVGAMCATGVLNVNAWGWPTLFLKIALFFGGASWLTLNRLDNRGHDYPLVRIKYAALLVLTPVVVAEFTSQWLYFSNMAPDVITSCCGALFSSDSGGLAADLAGLSPRTALLGLVATGVAVLAAGIGHGRYAGSGGVFALASTAAFVMALVAIVSFIALYVYEHPHHHCPFCLLKAGYGYVGYALYVPLFLATAAALMATVIAHWRRIPSLADAVTQLRPRYTGVAVSLFAVFYLLSALLVASSSLTMAEVWW